MTRVLVIGYAPEDVDFSDPAIPPDMNAKKVAHGIAEDMEKFHARGWDADHLPIFAKSDLRKCVLDQVKKHKYDCIVIGGGVRLTTKRIPQLEVVVNAVREGAPTVPIAFNAGPEYSSEAAARWVE
jgi:hypothetical protein